MVPEPSWDAVHGRPVEKVPAWTMESVWQFEATATFTRRSVGEREEGTGTVLIL